ncbi:MAG: anion permease [Promethearchaeota archaeon]
MTALIIIGAALLLGFVVAFTIGANDETMTPAVGAGLLSLSVAVLIGGLFNFIGVFFLGESVSKTVGNKFTTPEYALSLSMVFVVLISMALWLFIVSLKGVPISTTQSVVGSVIGVALIEWGLISLNYDTLFWVLLSWVVSPLIGLVGGFLFYALIIKLRQSVKTKGYADYERQEKVAFYALAVFLLISVFSRSGNDVAKAIGPLMAIEDFVMETYMVGPFPITGLYLALIAGGLGMCFGVIFLGRRVVKKLANDIVALSPTSALAASISVSLIMFFGTLMAIPLSGSHILVAAFIGVGFVNKEKVDKDSLKEIGISWVITTPISALFSAIIYVIFNLLGEFFVALYT